MWLAHKTYLQSNIGLAYKLKLKLYHMSLIKKNQSLIENEKFKNYTSEYYKTTYDTQKFPQIELKPN
tara:strand:+ start:971 stop:1171 length:201 start_codon:yes stop_codon:yes gene_type:complete